MMLGDVLAQLYDDSEAAELILGAGELSLLASAREQAEIEGVDLATYARFAVQRYVAAASGEEWVSAMSALSRADDPSSELLKRALRPAPARRAGN